MATLKELMAKQSPDSQQRIAAKAAEIRQSVALNLLREELQMSQTEMAAAMGVKQPTIAKMEQADNDPRLSTLKRYIAALGRTQYKCHIADWKKSRLICEQVSGPSASHSPGISLGATRCQDANDSSDFPACCASHSLMRACCSAVSHIPCLVRRQMASSVLRTHSCSTRYFSSAS